MTFRKNEAVERFSIIKERSPRGGTAAENWSGCCMSCSLGSARPSGSRLTCRQALLWWPRSRS